MTEGKIVPSSPTSHSTGKWKLPRIAKFGVFKRSTSNLFSKSSTAQRAARGHTEKDMKDFVHRGTSMKVCATRNTRRGVETGLLMFSGITGRDASRSDPRDCGETVSVSYNNEGEENDWIMASHKGVKIPSLTKDHSFDSHATDLSSSASSLEDEEIRSFCSCEENKEELNTSSCSIRVVRFADEEGLPMEDICHLTKEDEHTMDRNHYEELLVLCLSPRDKKFEFLHIGYFPQANIEELRRATTVQDLLQGLPSMATDPLFHHATFDALYRNTSTTELGLLTAQRIPDGDLLLRDCSFRKNEIIIASMTGSQEEDLILGAGPLLGNARLMKRVKRGRQSGRGLKLVHDKTAASASKKSKSSKRRRSPKSKRSISTRNDPTRSSSRGSNELMDECRNEHECGYLQEGFSLDDEESKRKKVLATLLEAALMITAGTILFSAMGI